MENVDVKTSNSAPALTTDASAKANHISKTESEVKVSANESVKQASKNLKHATEVAEQALSVDELKTIVRELQEALPEVANSLRFVVDDVLERPIVSVIDEKSGEVIRQLPSEEVVRAARNIEIMRGILFDQAG